MEQTMVKKATEMKIKQLMKTFQKIMRRKQQLPSLKLENLQPP